MFIQCYNWLVAVFNHSLGPPAMFITVFSKDSCNYYKSFVKSVTHSSYDKEALITILMICEPGYSPGNNSSIYNILKVWKTKQNKKPQKKQDGWYIPIRNSKNDSFIVQLMVLFPKVDNTVCELDGLFFSPSFYHLNNLPKDCRDGK